MEVASNESSNIGVSLIRLWCPSPSKGGTPEMQSPSPAVGGAAHKNEKDAHDESGHSYPDTYN